MNISVFFFCTRQTNLNEIISTYNSHKFINEILIVHLENVSNEIKNLSNKTKFIYMPKDSDLGLLSRYTFALSCKNRYVFIQDDDWVYTEDFFNKIINTKQPIAGAHGRWFEDGKYTRKKNKSLNTAPIVLTTGVLVDTYYLPKVIEYAKEFWPKYQNVFNGEDIFMNLVISKISKIKEFPIFTNKKYYKFLNTEGRELSKDINSSKDRTEITKKIYSFLDIKNETS
jgi:hypothetical protein